MSLKTIQRKLWIISYIKSLMIVKVRNRTVETNETPNKVQLILPYFGKQGMKLITKIKKNIKKTLPSDIPKFKAIFKISCKRQFYHQSNLVYCGKSTNQTCRGEYIGEPDHRIEEKSNLS